MFYAMLLFLVGRVLAMFGSKQVRTAGVVLLLIGAGAASAILLMAFLPIILVIAFPLILVYVLYKVLL